jgi:hypothetical protein
MPSPQRTNVSWEIENVEMRIETKEIPGGLDHHDSAGDSVLLKTMAWKNTFIESHPHRFSSASSLRSSREYLRRIFGMLKRKCLKDDYTL